MTWASLTTLRPQDVVQQRGMRVVSDAGSLEPICADIVAKNPAQADQYRAGKKGVFGFLVGQVMNASGGSADPKLVNQILVRLLGSGSEATQS